MLPSELETLLEPLFSALPLDQAMTALVVHNGAPRERIETVEALLKSEPFASNPTLAAGLWLYIDELDRSHTISQSLKSATGSFWHGIMHRREGDFGNSHYWFNRTGHHPAMAVIEHYDPHRFIDDVDATRGSDADALVALQRSEWAALMAWCYENPA